MKRYKLLNNVLGWVVFVIAAVTYILTLESTASFWDCGEFIASGYKLEVGHPPGNPIFMLTARFFANFASSPSEVAYMVNLMSGLLSAATILLLFWTITRLAQKIVLRDGETEETMSLGQMIAILGCGLVGALAILVLGGGRRGLCLFVVLYRIGVLAYPQMGKRGRPAACQPLHYFDSLYHRSFDCGSPVESFVYPGHRIGLLLP